MDVIKPGLGSKLATRVGALALLVALAACGEAQQPETPERAAADRAAALEPPAPLAHAEPPAAGVLGELGVGDLERDLDVVRRQFSGQLELRQRFLVPQEPHVAAREQQPR